MIYFAIEFVGDQRRGAHGLTRSVDSNDVGERDPQAPYTRRRQYVFNNGGVSAARVITETE